MNKNYKNNKYNIIFIIFIIFFISIIIFFYYKYTKYIENFNENNNDIEGNKIYCFWTGDNEMSSNRQKALEDLRNISECNVILVTKNNLNKYILDDVPLHPSYEYLSETHKADYLRTYFMNFHGGGYSDIKKTTGSWTNSFNDLKNSDYWICGYKEIDGGVAYGEHVDKWRELIGNVAYICKPQTPLTKEWYNEMIELLDSKLEKLKENPSKHPQDSFNENGSKYPIEWNEMLGRIFHKVSYKYKDKLLTKIIELLNY